jgi:hypothetical protein
MRIKDTAPVVESSMRTSRYVFSAVRTDSNGIEKVFGFAVGKDVTLEEETALKI